MFDKAGGRRKSLAAHPSTDANVNFINYDAIRLDLSEDGRYV